MTSQDFLKFGGQWIKRSSFRYITGAGNPGTLFFLNDKVTEGRNPLFYVRRCLMRRHRALLPPSSLPWTIDKRLQSLADSDPGKNHKSQRCAAVRSDKVVIGSKMVRFMIDGIEVCS